MKKKLLAAALTVMMLAAVGCGKKAKVTLGEYKGIALTSATDEQVDAQVNTILNNYATTEAVDRAAVDGDTVNINFVGTMDGVAFEGGTDDSEAGSDLVLGSGRMIPGFEEGLVGAVAGEERVLNLTFPDPYENNPDYAGLPVEFKVTINEVKEKVVPELTLEFLTANSAYTSIEEFMTELRANMNKSNYNSQIRTALMANCTVENIPEEDVTAEKNAYVNQIMTNAQSLATQYAVDVAVILQVFYGHESEEALNTYAEEYARGQITYSTILAEIAKEEKLEVTDEKYTATAELYATQYNYTSVDEFITAVGEDAIREATLLDSAVEFCITNGVVDGAAN